VKHPYAIALLLCFLTILPNSFFERSVLALQVSPQRPLLDNKAVISIEGEIARVTYTSSSVRIDVKVTNKDEARVVNWIVETGSRTDLAKAGIKLTDFKIGTTVKVRGRQTGNQTLEALPSDISY